MTIGNDTIRKQYEQDFQIIEDYERPQFKRNEEVAEIDEKEFEVINEPNEQGRSKNSSGFIIKRMTAMALYAINKLQDG